MISILIIDRTIEFCERLKSILTTQPDLKVHFMGTNAYEALDATEKLKPDILFIEYELPSINPTSFHASIEARSKKTKIIFVTEDYPDKISLVYKLALTNVLGYLSKSELEEQAIKACRMVSSGYLFVSWEIASCLFRQFSKLVLENFSKNEIKDAIAAGEGTLYLNAMDMSITQCLKRGLSDKEIAAEIGITRGTVRNYISAILRKTGLNNRTQLALAAAQGLFAEKKPNYQIEYKKDAPQKVPFEKRQTPDK